MKFLVFVASTVAASAALACTQNEAQIIAKVSSVDKSAVRCTAMLDAKDVRFYSSSVVCPLLMDDVLVNGVEVGLVNGHDCALEAGDEVNGIVYRDQSGFIKIEKN